MGLSERGAAESEDFMARVTVEDCLEQVQDNRFALVHLVSKRAKDLRRGEPPTQAVRKNNYEIVNALREISKNCVFFKGAHEARAEDIV